MTVLILTPVLAGALTDTGAFPPVNVKAFPELSRDLYDVLDRGDRELNLIVQFRDGPSKKELDWLGSLGFEVKRTLSTIDAVSIIGPRDAFDALSTRMSIAYIENNDPVVSDMEMGTNVINATQVWASLRDTPLGILGPIDGSGVTVAVVDTGIDAGHPDLDYGSKTIVNVYDAGNNIWLESENTDMNAGHGTHVAGTVAGNGDASAGARRGVAPGANLIGVTISMPESSTTPTEDGYIQGLEWVYLNSRPGSNPHNIRVVTNSWHSTVTEYDPESALTKVIEKITFENNVVSTWSAGNDGRDDPEGNELTTSGQGNTPVAIMVAAYERDGSAVTDFSSRGRVGANHTYPDIGAPGRSIWSCSARRTVISAGTYVGGNTNPYYLAISGTSMSTPHVAGLAALLWQAAPSMRMSGLHEDYSGDDPAGWYGNPNTRIHEAEWILEASARYLSPTPEHGNVGGDTDSTGWGGKPIDYVQGYGLVDARRAVGIALTLERLRRMCADPSEITVLDAIKAYDGQGVAGTTIVSTTTAIAEWSGEFSRYNDQAMNPLSLVNQTKYLTVPMGATRAVVTMTYSGLDVSEFKAGDLSFTIDTNGDGTVDQESGLSFLDGGVDTMELDAAGGDIWTFGIVGRGLKAPRPFQGTNYVELRMEYDISVSFELGGNMTQPARGMNAVHACILPAEGQAIEGPSSVDVFVYRLRKLELPQDERGGGEEGEGPPLLLVLVILIAIITCIAVYFLWKRRKKVTTQ
jgi:serine protease AprX